MIVFPLFAAVVAAVFSFLLLRQWSNRRRWPQLAWGVAMVMYAIASLAVAFGVSGGWTPSIYKVYWLFGALVNVPWLALGSIALLNNRILTYGALVLVVIGSLFAFWKVATGDVTEKTCVSSGQRQVCHTAVGDDDSGRPQKDIPRGKDAWFDDGSVRSLATLYSYPAFFVVVGIALWTSRPRKGVKPPPRRVRANMLIAGGTTIVAIGGSALARFAQGSVFSFTLAVGIATMFVGFLWATPKQGTTVQ